jgi:hypothetical protein
MRPPPEYFVSKGMVCHFCRSLYGLKQAPHAWFQRFVSVVTAADFPPVLMIRLSSFTYHLMVGLFSFFTWMT